MVYLTEYVKLCWDVYYFRYSLVYSIWRWIEYKCVSNKFQFQIFTFDQIKNQDF